MLFGCKGKSQLEFFFYMACILENLISSQQIILLDI